MSYRHCQCVYSPLHDGHARSQAALVAEVAAVGEERSGVIGGDSELVKVP